MPDHSSLDGEIAIVTGGARGIGKAVAELFVAHGAAVVFCDREPELGQEVEQQLGARAKFVAADVSVEADVASVVDTCVQTHGPPTVLVSNAGVNANFDATTMTPPNRRGRRSGQGDPLPRVGRCQLHHRHHDPHRRRPHSPPRRLIGTQAASRHSRRPEGCSGQPQNRTYRSGAARFDRAHTLCQRTERLSDRALT
jgi:hypothetical protein